MARILILYPKAFNCYAKFERKLDRITSALSNGDFIAPADDNGLLEKYTQKQSSTFNRFATGPWNYEDITHAIVFDDGEEFPQETEALRAAQVPLRLVTIAITRVINIKREPDFNGAKSTPTYEYIGRGAYWGNPHSMFEGGDDRDEVIRKFKYDFDFDKFLNIDTSQVYSLAGKRLGCFCKPAPCHGDVLADFLNSWDDGK